MSKKRIDKRKEVGVGSENPFAALDLPDADVRLAKAELSRLIHRVIQERKLTQAQAACLMGIAQPDVSELVRGRLRRFSLERLERFLNALDLDVTIRVTPRPAWKKRSGITVEYAVA
jgi:predicted XRE-type DNA-binding protein